MMNKILTLFLSLFLVFAITGCSQSSQDDMGTSDLNAQNDVVQQPQTTTQQDTQIDEDLQEIETALDELDSLEELGSEDLDVSLE